MNIDYDDVEMKFKCTVTFTAKVKDTVHKHEDLSNVEEKMINKIYNNPEEYMDQLEVENVDRLL
ncbi:hypothetical protein [Staphylococcus simulans]|uniref:hypothetical protein n=1 Tax=Staphylococcus simulans TaxID=1286 RepID=UPI00313313B6